jgi:hypothetical protein
MRLVTQPESIEITFLEIQALGSKRRRRWPHRWDTRMIVYQHFETADADA